MLLARHGHLGKDPTGSNADAGLTFFFFNAPSLLAPLSGLLADRVRRRPLLIVMNFATGGAVLLLLLVHRAGRTWLIYVVNGPLWFLLLDARLGPVGAFDRNAPS